MIAEASTRTAPVERAAAYRLIAELLLYPDERSAGAVSAWRRALRQAPEAVRGPVERFLAHPRAEDPDEYLSVLELAPPCPLYLGAYLYEEPSTCRGAGLSQRNAYMMELQAAYHHYGLELARRELADHLPVMLEFLALSWGARAEHDDGVRRRFLDLGVRRALPAMLAALRKHESPYALLVEALVPVVDDDLADETAPAPARDVGDAIHETEVPS